MTAGEPGDALARALTATTAWAPSRRWSVPIRECGEPLRPLAGISDLIDVRLVPARARHLGKSCLWARGRVVEMLARMAADVAPAYRVVVVDAYRSLGYQRQRFEHVLEQARSEDPTATEDELRARTDSLVAIPATDPQRPPPHSTGGAIDMMLEDVGSGTIDYGSRISRFEDPDENARHATNAPGLEPEQREARVRLVTAAITVGFANHPGEWWHFMFGDQEHALAAGGEVAVYGRADLVPGRHTG